MRREATGLATEALITTSGPEESREWEREAHITGGRRERKRESTTTVNYEGKKERKRRAAGEIMPRTRRKREGEGNGRVGGKMKRGTTSENAQQIATSS